VAKAAAAGVIQDSGPLRESVGPPGLMPGLKGKPPPLTPDYITIGQVKAGAGVIELLEQRANSGLPCVVCVGFVGHSIPGTQKCRFALRREEQKTAPATYRILPATASGPDAYGYVCQPAPDYQVQAQCSLWAGRDRPGRPRRRCREVSSPRAGSDQYGPRLDIELRPGETIGDPGTSRGSILNVQLVDSDIID
jgi:hypothetical protein